ncbi:hypothetical protein [Cupriavidus sp. CuC1]|uniref:hypothetical protein n=1 Tax=Cupriavidus sp. CuC1 TaxID=3373131 RepID=UPI0037CD2E26
MGRQAGSSTAARSALMLPVQKAAWIFSNCRRVSLEVRRRLHLGMRVNYVGDDPMGPLQHGSVIELRHTQAVIEDTSTRRRWAVLYAAVVLDRDGAPVQPEPERTPQRAKRDEFSIGDTVVFTDKYLHERIGTIVRLNQKTASIACNDTEGHWRMSYALLRRIVDA